MGGRDIQKEQALKEAYKELILPPFDTRHAHILGLLVAISHIDIQRGYVRIPYDTKVYEDPTIPDCRMPRLAADRVFATASRLIINFCSHEPFKRSLDRARSIYSREHSRRIILQH